MKTRIFRVVAFLFSVFLLGSSLQERAYAAEMREDKNSTITAEGWLLAFVTLLGIYVFYEPRINEVHQ